MARRQPSKRELELIVENWNLRYPIGTAVSLKRGNQGFHTKTRSEAELLGGHTPVIWVDGLSGCYALDHVTPITE